MTSLHNLPIEVILQIFENLDLEDLLSVTETCRQFYQICQKKSIADQFLVRVTTANQKLLKNASRNFNYRFIFETLFHFNQFCLQNIQELFMENIKTINFFLLVQTIHKIQNLKKLVIKDCDFKTLDDFVIVNEKKVIESKLSLNSLVLHSNRMDNGQLGYLLSPITDLICFYYSAYEQSGNENKSLVIDFLCNPKFSPSLKELTLRSEGCDLDPIFKTNHFNLKKFSFFCRRPTVNSNIVETFLTSQTNLNYLGVNFAPNNYKLLPKMLTVCRRLEKLNYFSFNFGNQPIKCSDDLECIWKLKGLELTFVNTSFFTALEKESKVTELHLSIVSLTCFCNSLKFWPNLIYLFLSKAVFTDDYYQAIFEHLLQLRELRIFNSYLMQISDFGITGESAGYSIKRLEKLETIVFAGEQNITDLSLTHFAGLKSLKRLLLGETNITNEGIDDFRRNSKAKLTIDHYYDPSYGNNMPRKCKMGGNKFS